MVDITIYPACLLCECPSFIITDEEIREYGTLELRGVNYIDRTQRISCEHDRVCKFIEGHEPIDMKGIPCRQISE